MPKWPEQLFILSNEAVEASSWDEVGATALAMQEMGLWKPPFPEFAVQVKGKHFLTIKNEDSPGWHKFGSVEELKSKFRECDLRVHFRNFNEINFETKTFIDFHDGFGFTELDRAFSYRTGGMLNEGSEELRQGVAAIYQWFNALLATKNILKTTVECKALKLGIGKPKPGHLPTKFRYTTTISIGKLEEHSSTGAPGEAKRPHLRRGHIRRQHYGPNFQFERKIWIAPVFVNGDREWTQPTPVRDHYNISKVKEPIL